MIHLTESDTDTCNYIKLCYFLKLLSVLSLWTCHCRCLHLCFIDFVTQIWNLTSKFDNNLDDWHNSWSAQFKYMGNYVGRWLMNATMCRNLWNTDTDVYNWNVDTVNNLKNDIIECNPVGHWHVSYTGLCF